MTDLLPLTDLSTLSTPDLRRELARGLCLTAEVLTQLGAVWAELERRGEDLSALRVGISRTLPLIAAGRLAAEAVVAFAGRPRILRALEGMDLALQNRLADGETVPVYLPGLTAPEALPIARIPATALSRVICDGVVRTPAEQRLAVRPLSRRALREARKYRVTVDRETRTLRIGRQTVPLAAVLAAMADAAGASGLVIDSPEAPAKTVAGKVTDDEKERLKAAGKAHGLEEWEMVRRAVCAMWLL